MTPEQFVEEAQLHAKNFSPENLDGYTEKMVVCSTCRYRQQTTCKAATFQDFATVCTLRAACGIECPKGYWKPKPLRPPGTINVVLFVPAAHNLGGIERWLIGMCRYLPLVSGGKVQVSSIIVQFGDMVGTELLPQLQQVAKVVQCYDTDESRTERQAALAESDVVVLSCLGEAAIDILKDYHGKVVWLSHSCCDYSKQYCRELYGKDTVTHWSSVGHLAKGVFPDTLIDQVVPMENGAEVDRCAPVFGGQWQRKQWGIPEDKIVIGYIGRLHWEKRPTFLAEALAHLPERYVGVMVGSGIHEPGTREECQKLVGNRVKFIGRMNLIGDAMAAMNFGFLASPAEGFCLSRTEMQLAGLPMFSTGTGELPRLEKQYGQMSWNLPIFAPGSVTAGIIEHAVASPQKTEEIIQRAKTVSWMYYTASAMAGRWSNWLQQIVGEP